MKLFLAVFVSAFALAMQAQPQTNIAAAVGATNTAPQLPAVRNTSVSAKAGMPTNATLVVLDHETQTLLENATHEPFIKTDTLVNALLGAVLAVVVGLLADRLRENRDNARKREDDKEFEHNTVLAIRRELETMGKIYESGIAVPLNATEEGAFFPVRLALTQDWFTIFSANAGHLGRIDADITHRIIACYALLKALIEEFRINNEYLVLLREGEAERWFPRPGLAMENLVNAMSAAQKQQGINAILVEQFKRIKRAEQNLKTAVNELFAILDGHGIK